MKVCILIIICVILLSACAAEFPGRAYDKAKFLEGVLLDGNTQKPLPNTLIKLYREKKTHVVNALLGGN